MSIKDAALVGVDGCPGGWLAVGQTACGALVWDVLADARTLFDVCASARVIAIDMPIGIPSRGHRTAEAAARVQLGPRASSVFNVPPRPCLAAGIDYAEACRRSFVATGLKLSKQSFAILPRIGEVDACLRADPGLAARVHEVHPEVSFAVWFGGQPARFPKATGFGFAERLGRVDACFPGAASAVRDAWKLRQVADDDILDAFAALWSARRIDEGQAVAVGSPDERDEFGLRMYMQA
jgi:predicted RNase H-like nuclease